MGLPLLLLLLLLLPLLELGPLLCSPGFIKLKVRPVAFALKELLGLILELPEPFNFAKILLILVSQVLVLLHEIESLVRSLAAFFDLFHLRLKKLNPLVGLLNLCLLLG